jgi:hypothetical protein
MSDALPSRRALRAAAEAASTQPAEVPLTRKQLREQERLKSESVGGTSEVAADEYISVSTGSIGMEPEPKSFVVEAVPDITNMTITISETGEQLQTGSIPLPAAVTGVTLQTGSITLPTVTSSTGEIQLVKIGNSADQELTLERAEGAIGGIAPIPARKHLRARRSNRVFPTRLKKGKGQVYFALFSIIVMVATAGVFLVLYLKDLI